MLSHRCFRATRRGRDRVPPREPQRVKTTLANDSGSGLVRKMAHRFLTELREEPWWWPLAPAAICGASRIAEKQNLETAAITLGVVRLRKRAYSVNNSF